MNLWDEILARIETKVNRHSFYTWFRPTTFVSRRPDVGDGAGAERAVQGLADEALLGRHHRSDGRAEAAELLVNFRGRFPGRCAAHSAQPRGSGGARRRSRRRSLSPGPPGSIPATPSTPSSSDRRISSRTPRAARSRKRRRAPTTRCSSTAAWDLGKTHLMHAVGHYVLQHDRNLKLTYISSERFMNEMINAVRYDRVHRFPRALSNRRRAAGRRHPVSRRERRHADRVLPHLQRARTTRRSRSSSAATARRTRFPRSRSGCDRASSGG